MVIASSSLAANKPSKAGSSEPYRIMLVDDSAVIRGMLSRWLSEDADFKVVGSYCNGAQAVQHVKNCGAEIAILDIEMPEMDGLTALPKLLEASPDLQIIMASTLTRRNADVSLKALSMGAVDYVPKPESARAGSGTDDFRRDLIWKTKALGRRIRQLRHPEAEVQRPAIGRSVNIAPAQNVAREAKRSPIALRRPSNSIAEILAIGSSTGGPQALFKVLGDLRGTLHVPVVITQHMPATFTAILAEHIQNTTGIPAKEAVEGDVLKPGQIYVAPGDFHMLIRQKGADRIVHIDNGPQVNFCRPAVDPMFESIAKLYGARALCVVLTGMGHDGRAGAEAIVDAGGTVIAQDEETSVVWGMPGAVAEAGLCSSVLPITEVARALRRHLPGVSQ